MLETWRVERHGGQTHYRWRAVMEGAAPAAWACYATLRPQVRRGSLRLVTPAGIVAAAVYVPDTARAWAPPNTRRARRTQDAPGP